MNRVNKLLLMLLISFHSISAMETFKEKATVFTFACVGAFCGKVLANWMTGPDINDQLETLKNEMTAHANSAASNQSEVFRDRFVKIEQQVQGLINTQLPSTKDIFTNNLNGLKSTFEQELKSNTEEILKQVDLKINALDLKIETTKKNIVLDLKNSAVKDIREKFAEPFLQKLANNEKCIEKKMTNMLQEISEIKKHSKLNDGKGKVDNNDTLTDCNKADALSDSDESDNEQEHGIEEMDKNSLWTQE